MDYNQPLQGKSKRVPILDIASQANESRCDAFSEGQEVLRHVTVALAREDPHLSLPGDSNEE